MKDQPKVKKVDADEGPLWCVLFDCTKGGVHPIRYGRKDGPSLGRAIIMAAAKAYLRENKHWLKSVSEAYPVESKTK